MRKVYRLEMSTSSSSDLVIIHSTRSAEMHGSVSLVIARGAI